MRLPVRRAYHVIYDISLQDALTYAHDNNWTGIVPDLGVPRFYHTEYSEDDRAELKTLSGSLKIEWGFHAPGDDVNLFTAYPPIRAAILTYFGGIIDFAKSVSNELANIVVHCGKIPSFRKIAGHMSTFQQEYYDFYYQVLHDNLLSFIEQANGAVTIAIENIAWTPLVREVIKALIPRGLRLCLDIPKLFTQDLGKIAADWSIFQKHSSAIDVVHLHDMSSEHRSHQVIGAGDIGFEESLRFLSQLDRPLQYVMEVRPREAANESLQAFEQLLEEIDISLR